MYLTIILDKRTNASMICYIFLNNLAEKSVNCGNTIKFCFKISKPELLEAINNKKFCDKFSKLLYSEDFKFSKEMPKLSSRK